MTQDEHLTMYLYVLIKIENKNSIICFVLTFCPVTDSCTADKQQLRHDTSFAVFAINDLY